MRDGVKNLFIVLKYKTKVLSFGHETIEYDIEYNKKGSSLYTIGSHGT